MASTKGAVNLDEVEGDEVEELDALDQEIDFESVKGAKTVPGGIYHLRVEGATAQLSKTSSQPKVNFRLMPLEGEDEGVTVFLDLSLAAGAIGRSKEILIGMGMPADARWSAKKIAQETKGWEFWAVLDVEESNGGNKRTQKVYAGRNKIVFASKEQIYDDDE